MNTDLGRQISRFAHTGAVAIGLAGLCGCVTAVASPPPWAADRGRVERYPVRTVGEYDDARVVAVDPILTRVRVDSPRRECWEEVRTEYPERARHGSTAGPMIIGGIIGGAIGSQVGQGRDIATVAGTLIGASIGHDSAVRSGREAVPEERVVERCETRRESTYRERVEGYRVTYEYRGREYTTRLPYDPGDRIRVRVDVSPAEY